jgi:DNA-binding CsgD family transcriptional regulator
MISDPGSLEELRRIAPDLAPSIAKLPMPAYILDRHGVVRWLNKAAVAVFGDIRGKRIEQIVERRYAFRARQEFAGKLLGTIDSTEASVALQTPDGNSVSVDISSSPLVENGVVVGVFGLADPSNEPPRMTSSSVHLTPRQLDVLRYLASGSSTEHTARALSISTETVRNHIRGIMERLGVHSRLEAVIRGQELGLI